VSAVEAVGGVAAIASSHPHMFGVGVEWARRVDGVPVYVNEAERSRLQRDDAVVEYWLDELDVLPACRCIGSAAISREARSRAGPARPAEACY
jgi:hypothetical protein